MLNDDPYNYNYLIKPGNPLYEKSANFIKGDRILLSGEFFIDSDTGYLATEELRKKSQILKPDFTFRFTSMEKIAK